MPAQLRPLPSHESFDQEKPAKPRRLLDLVPAAERAEPVDVEDYYGLMMPGVTQFVEGGVPNVALRRTYTADALRKVRNMFRSDPEAAPGAWKEAQKIVQSKPRIFAHADMRDVPIRNGLNGSVEWGSPEVIDELLPDAIQSQLNAGKTSIGGADLPHRFPTNIGKKNVNTLVHEATHVAQGLGNKDAPEMYNSMSKAIEASTMSRLDPYRSLPEELSATRSALKRSDPETFARVNPRPFDVTRNRGDLLGRLEESPAKTRLMELMKKRSIRSERMP